MHPDVIYGTHKPKEEYISSEFKLTLIDEKGRKKIITQLKTDKKYEIIISEKDYYVSKSNRCS